ncbi:MAG TPA: PQQ-binding-like beta-propeller repeat protein [Bacillota bacterium]|nr:PQQ-binding-like beta-propeller repeat protein [Bacillota bacterium]
MKSSHTALLAAVVLCLALAACGRPAAKPAQPPVPTPSRSSTPTASVTPTATSAPPPASVLTYRGDFARTGWYQNESALTADVAARFAPLWQSPTVNGRIYAQPLVDGAHALVLVATTANDIYAFHSATGALAWGPVNVGQPVPRSLLACGDVDPVGILSTPVLDPTTSTLYAVAQVRQGAAGMAYEILALDSATGAMRPGYPVALQAPSGFNVRYQQQRAALTLLNGTLYVPFGGYWGDCGPYHGWLIGVPLSHPTAQQSFMVPTAREGAIWSAAGVATAPDGTLYATTGNGSSSGPVDFGNAVLHIQTQPSLGFNRQDFFAPSNFAALNDQDADIGSASPVILPPQTGTTTPNLIFAMGKPGVAYLLNRDSLGGLSHGNGITGEGLFSACLFGPCGQQRAGSFATAAYWQGGSAGNFLFAAGGGHQPAPCQAQGGVLGLRLGTQSNGASDFSVGWCSVGMTDPGSPAVTGPTGGNAVVWVIDTRGGRLYALSAATGKTIWSADIGQTERFIAPAIAGGRVFVGVPDRVLAFAAP